LKVTNLEDYFSDTGKKRQLEMALFWGSFEENGENVGQETVTKMRDVENVGCRTIRYQEFVIH